MALGRGAIRAAVGRVMESEQAPQACKDNIRLLLVLREGVRYYVSAGWVCAEMDSPGYASRHKRHRPRQEGVDATHEVHFRDAGFLEIPQAHALFPAIFDDYLATVGQQFDLGAEWSEQRRRTLSKKEGAFVFLIESTLPFEEFDADAEKRGAPEQDVSRYVAHPETCRLYPADAIFRRLAPLSDPDAGEASRALDALGYAADTEEAAQHHAQLYEGAARQYSVNGKERSPLARRLCIEAYLKRDGRLACQVCGMCFAERYGEIGEGFIHIHHVTPIAESSGARPVDPETDLVPVCPNCHAMIHVGGLNRDPDTVKRCLNDGTK